MADQAYTTEERKKIADFWNEKKASPPGLSEIVSFFTEGAENDPRTAIGHKVRKILADLQIKPKTKEYIPLDNIVLSPEQKEFIDNNSKNNKAIELARIIFPDRAKDIKPLCKEHRLVNHYLKEIGHVDIESGETMAEGRYEPPTSIQTVLKKVNQYLHEELTLQNMTAYDKKCLETVRQFLHAPRFVQEINNYFSVEKRVSFESEYIRATYSKPDLTPEEVSLTINWCSDIIQAADLKKLLQNLHNSLENITDDNQGKYSQSLAVTIGEVTSNLNEVLKRQERIYGLLNKSRAKRNEDKANKTANIAALFEFFREEEGRKKLLIQTEILKELRKGEVKRQESLSDTILLSLGLSQDEAIN